MRSIDLSRPGPELRPKGDSAPNARWRTLIVDTILNTNLIVSNPDVRNGRPVVAGTGVCVSDVAAAKEQRLGSRRSLVSE